jgi:tRNA (guanine-N7-)-methyltransferase
MRPKSENHLGRKKRPLDGAGVLIEKGTVTGALDLAEIFGNTRPVELEIGIGKGTFLTARAEARPEINFIGLEYAGAYATFAADRCRRAGLDNVRILDAEANSFVETALSEASLFRVHIYFPDPWPKRKHNRRRLIQPAFVDQLRRVVQPGGQVLVVTDHMDYFEQIRKVFANARGFVSISFPRMADESGQIVGTNFERKYIAQGRPFYSAALLRYE